jgi:hypothetical protein
MQRHNIERKNRGICSLSTPRQRTFAVETSLLNEQQIFYTEFFKNEIKKFLKVFNLLFDEQVSIVFASVHRCDLAPITFSVCDFRVEITCRMIKTVPEIYQKRESLELLRKY